MAALKLGFPAQSTILTGGVQLQSKISTQPVKQFSAQNSAVSSGVQLQSKISASPIKQLPAFKKPPPPTPPDDHSKLYEGPDPLLGNANFGWLLEEGVNTNSPDIIAVTNFQPAYYDIMMAQQASSGLSISSPFGAGAYMSPVGKMLMVRIWSRELIAANMTELLATLKSYPELTKTIEDREAELLAALKQSVDDVDFLVSFAANIERLRRAFDVKRVLSNEDAGSSKLSLPPKGPAVLPLAALMSKHLGFDENNVRMFANTKIVQQLVFDLSRIVSRHSYTLFGAPSQTRKLDASYITIERSPDVAAATLKFNLASLGSVAGQPRDASSPVFYKQLDDALPSSPIDRAKLLSVVVSREMRVSLGLGDKPTVLSIAAKYPAITNAGDPFASIIGSVGHKMTDSIAGPDQSLAALTQLTVTAGRTVLPFESSFVNASGPLTIKQKLFVPGPSYFVDPIVTGQPAQFDTAPLKSLSNRIDRNIASAKDALGRLLQLESLVDDPGDLFEDSVSLRSIAALLFSTLNQQLNGITPKSKLKTPGPEAANVNVQQLFDDPNQVAMFLGAVAAQAQGDLTLRVMLFRYAMLSGIIAHTEGVRKGSFFADLAESDELSVVTQNINAEFAAVVAKIAAHVIPKNKKSPTKSALVPPEYAVVSTDKSTLEWILKTIATKATSTTSGFSYTWLDRFEEALNAFNDVLNKGSAKLNGLTRRSSMSLSTFALLMFEMFTAFMANNVPAKFVIGQGAGTVRIALDVIRSRSVIRVVQLVRSKLESNPSLASGGPKNAFEQSKLSELQSVADAISSDDEAIVSIIRVLDKLNDGIQSATKDIAEKYAKGGKNEKRFKELQDVVVGAPVLIDNGQIVLARALTDEVIEQVGKNVLENKKPKLSLPGKSVDKATDTQPGSSQPLFIDADAVMTTGMTNALFSMLRSPEMKGQNADGLRILTIGIPAGFSSTFKNVVDTSKPISNAFVRRQDDVLSVNIYKQDEQYDGIVFKPQRRLFELTRFVLRTGDPDVTATDTFDAAVAKLDYRDYSLDRYSLQGSPKPPGADELFTDESYAFLSPEQKLELRRNHAMSALLDVYVRLLTDVGLDEKTFVVNAQALTAANVGASTFFKNAANIHISKTLGVQVVVDDAVGGDLFADAQLVQQATGFDQQQSLGGSEKAMGDLQTFAKLFASKSIVSNGQIERARLLTPKLFERVFNVAIDSSGFDIDEKLSDGSVLEALLKQGIIQVVTDQKTNEHRLRMVRRSTNDGHTTFEKYMVTVSTSSDALPTNVAYGVQVINKAGLGALNLTKLGAL